MIFELKKNLFSHGGDFVLRDENFISFCSLDFIKGGMLINNEKSKLIGQILRDNDGVTVSIADSPSIRVTNNFDIIPTPLKEEEKSFISDPDKARINKSEYSYFGNPINHRYDIYLKTKSVIQPIEVASVIPHPWKEDCFKIRINDNCNTLKVLALILAFSLITSI